MHIYSNVYVCRCTRVLVCMYIGVLCIFVFGCALMCSILRAVLMHIYSNVYVCRCTRVLVCMYIGVLCIFVFGCVLICSILRAVLVHIEVYVCISVYVCMYISFCVYVFLYLRSYVVYGGLRWCTFKCICV